MSFLSLLAHRAALIFAYSALIQIAAKAARPWTSVSQGVPVYRPPSPNLRWQQIIWHCFVREAGVLIQNIN